MDDSGSGTGIVPMVNCGIGVGSYREHHAVGPGTITLRRRLVKQESLRLPPLRDVHRSGGS